MSWMWLLPLGLAALAAGLLAAAVRPLKRETERLQRVTASLLRARGGSDGGAPGRTG